MGHKGQDKEKNTVTSQGGYKPSRGFIIGMAGVVFFAGVLTLAGLVAAERSPEPSAVPTGPAPPFEITYIPRPTTPPEDITADISSQRQEGTALAASAVPSTAAPATTVPVPPNPVATHPAATPSSSTSESPEVVASSWWMGPVRTEIGPVPPLADTAAQLAALGENLFGIRIVTEGQDWGEDEGEQVGNIGAVLSAMQLLPRTVTSSVVSHPHGPLTVLSNRDGRTEGGWQPYGPKAISFYTNYDHTADARVPANQVVLATGADRETAAHEILHAYQFRDVESGGYVDALLGLEMRTFMRATGWKQLVSDAEVLAHRHSNWDEINTLYEYRGTDAALWAPNPVEAFAVMGAHYYARPAGQPLADAPAHWRWFDRYVGSPPVR